MVRGITAGKAFVRILADSTQLEQGLKRAQARLKAFSASAVAAGLKVGAIGTAVSLPFALAAKEFANFQTSMAKVGTLLDGNKNLLNSFGKSVQDLSVRFGKSTEEIAEGLFDLISASIPADQAIDTLTASLKLSVAGFTDVRTATKAVIRVIKAYGDEAGSAADVSDFLFQTAKLGIVTFEELAQSIGSVAGVAGISGIKMSEFGAALASITKLEGADVAVTLLRNILLSFIKPATEAAKLSKELGIELNQAALSGEGFLSVMTQLKSLPASTLSRLFPEKRALRGILSIIRDFDKFKENITNIENDAGSTQKAFLGVIDTLEVVFNRLKAFAILLAQTVGAELADDITKMASAFFKVGRAVKILLEANKRFIPILAKVALGIIGVGAALFILGLAAGALGFIFGGIATLIGVFVSVIVTVFSPIGIFTILIIVLAAVVIERFGLIEKATLFLGQQFQRLSRIFRDAFDTILRAVKIGNLEGAFAVIAASVILVWQKMITEVTNMWEDFKVSIINIAVDIGGGILAGFVIAFSGVAKAWARVQNFLSDGIGKVRDSFKKGFIGFENFVDTAAALLNQKIFNLSDEVTLDVISKNNKQARLDKQKIDDEQKASLAASEEKLKGKIKNIEEEATARLGIIGKEGAKIKVEQRRARDAAIDSAKKDLEEARAALESTVLDVNTETEKQEIAAQLIKDAAGDVEDPFEGLKRALSSIVLEDPFSKNKLSAVGSFSAFGFDRNQPTTIERNALDKQDTMIKELRNIRTNTKATAGLGVLG